MRDKNISNVSTFFPQHNLRFLFFFLHCAVHAFSSSSFSNSLTCRACNERAIISFPLSSFSYIFYVFLALSSIFNEKVLHEIARLSLYLSVSGTSVITLRTSLNRNRDQVFFPILLECSSSPSIFASRYVFFFSFLIHFRLRHKAPFWLRSAYTQPEREHLKDSWRYDGVGARRAVAVNVSFLDCSLTHSLRCFLASFF